MQQKLQLIATNYHSTNSSGQKKKTIKLNYSIEGKTSVSYYFGSRAYLNYSPRDELPGQLFKIPSQYTSYY